TTVATVGPSLIALSDGYVQSVNFEAAGGQYLLAVNGADALRLFDGTTWRAIGAGTGAIASGTAAGVLATITTADPHNLLSGDGVTIAGATPGAYNGTYTVTVTAPDAFTYTAGAAPGGPMTVLGTWTYGGIGITGLPTSQLAGIAVSCQRVWFVEKDALSAWYLPVGQIGGALTEFPVGQVFPRGGRLIAIGTWTIDGGDGSDDYTVFVSSGGELAVYKGTDPSNAATFGKVGVYYVGEPLGRNCLCKYGGDLLVLCQNGLFPLSKALQSAVINRAAALTAKIDTAFTEAASLYGQNPGWQAVVYPGGNLLLVNIPVTGAYTLQYVMNTITGSWCVFSGLFASSWLVFGGKLHFASDTKIARAWEGTSDFGAAIVGKAQQAYTAFGVASRQKHVKLVRPLINVDGSVTLQMGFDVDYAANSFASVTNATVALGYAWDGASTKWDEVTWAADTEAKRDWATVAAREGYVMAFRMQVSTTSVQIKWSATDFALESGGVL
ncbi:MAG: hypothetical protein AzoDbin1_05109, partial [Azoarcus sp.]|nr:hypothetical protein [Azoarcus sp.]